MKVIMIECQIDQINSIPRKNVCSIDATSCGNKYYIIKDNEKVLLTRYYTFDGMKGWAIEVAIVGFTI